MSRESKDTSYIAKVRKQRGPIRESNRLRQKEQVDYGNQETVESDSEREYMVSESGFGSVKEELQGGFEKRS